MIAVIFEVTPSADGRDRYLELAAELKPLLQEIDGFLSIERFQSLPVPGKLPPLSFGRAEAAVQAWRRLEAHLQAQSEGRAGVFADYRLRVAAVLRDYGMQARDEAPTDSRERHRA